MSQDYISALFDGLFFIIISLLILVSSVLESYVVFQNAGFIAALIDFYPGLLWSGGSFLLGLGVIPAVIKEQTTPGIRSLFLIQTLNQSDWIRSNLLA